MDTRQAQNGDRPSAPRHDFEDEFQVWMVAVLQRRRAAVKAVSDIVHTKQLSARQMIQQRSTRTRAHHNRASSASQSMVTGTRVPSGLFGSWSEHGWVLQ